MQADPFKCAVGAVVIRACDGGARHQADIGHGPQFGQRLIHPLAGGQAVDFQTFGQQPPAHARIFICQDHIGTGARGGQGRHQARRTSANHQQIAECERLFINAHIGLARQLAKASGAADHRLIQFFPEGARPHEGFVVESSA